MNRVDTTQTEEFKAFLESAKASGGSELANCQPFVDRLCGYLGIAGPDLAQENNQFNDYVFERRVDFKHSDGTRTPGRIDCYKRGAFILEAKQSSKRDSKPRDAQQLALLPEDGRQHKPGHAKRGTRTWDKVMSAARRQAEDYARALPVSHGYPPFLLIVDVGHVIEVFADFSGQGKNYAHFPDRQSFRLSMDDLLDAEIQDRLRAIWSDPLSLDPAKKSAEVTRDIADRLAKIAKRLEGKHDPRDVAEFLMRCLFTMFAEDVDLLPDGGFEKLLDQMKETPKNFVPALESLWQVMDTGGYAPHLNATVKRFNGALFKTSKALPLDAEDIHELAIAAKRDWQDVEPAIFGTLLERALDPRERSKLGAHYTPRAYVERLVIPTIIEPLRDDWEDVQTRVQELYEQGDEREALRVVRRFHRKLCSTRVLDPACGTGNFLYVSLELMKKLEGEVLDAIAELGGQPDRYQDYPDEAGRDLVGQKLARTAGRFSVDPHQFYGLEINPRAVPIADLVLWIGYLKWQLKTGGPNSVTEPVLDAYGTIRQQDAILAYDARDLQRDDAGKPLSRWDGITTKPHPITGEDVPDPSAQVELYDYINPRPADWPQVEFIVGNPPFTGRRKIRQYHDDGYLRALSNAYPKFPENADLVMYWWELAGRCLLANPPHIGFGLITTNSIKQAFNRRVTEPFLYANKSPLFLKFAIPDHPWVEERNGASVRISMTIVTRIKSEGKLTQVVSEFPSKIESIGAKIEFKLSTGFISSRLRIGARISDSKILKANADISSVGYQLTGRGFILSASEREKILSREPGSSSVIHESTNGMGIQRRIENKYAIDVSHLSAMELQSDFPVVFQHLSETVRSERSLNSVQNLRNYWWKYARSRNSFRPSLRNIARLLVTSLTASNRIFDVRNTDLRADSTTVILALEKGEFLSLVSSRVHIIWALASGAQLGVGNDPRYTKSNCFDAFPFPACVTDDSNSNLTARLSDLGERLDAFRKERLDAHDFLTMTGLYNVLERVRELENECDVPPLTDKERDIYDAGQLQILKELHDDIDRATIEAYGWDDLIPELVGKPGATTPSLHKTEDQEAAEEELLSRLVALNQERAAEEANGQVRWLRPDYQIPKLGHKVKTPDAEQLEAELPVAAATNQPAWPTEELDQIRIVREVLAKAPAPALPGDIAALFSGRNTQKRKTRVDTVLQTLVAAGTARTGESDGQTRYFLPR